MDIYDLDNPDLRLEPDNDLFNKQLSAVLKMMAPFFKQEKGITIEPFIEIDPKECFHFAESMLTPENGGDLFSDAFYKTLTYGMNSNSGEYMGDIPGGGLPYSSLADFITSILNRWPGLYEGAPALIEIERYLIKWLCKLTHFPEKGGGIFTSGGSMANFSALFAARINKLNDELSKGIIYLSDQAHHSIIKAAYMAGFRKDQVRIIETDLQCKINPEALVKTMAEDKENGYVPFFIMANAGTTNTGAVDDLTVLGRIARQFNCWLHIDAAWAGSFLLTERGKKYLTGIGLADSITIDPHKAFWTPWGSGILLVKNPECLAKAFEINADYMPFDQVRDLSLNPSVLSPELSRNVRGLQLWLPLKMCGIDCFSNYLNEKLNLGDWLNSQLQNIPFIDVCYPPVFGVLGFTAHLPEDKNVNQEQRNSTTQKLYEKILADRRTYISTTVVKGKLIIRIAPLQFKTHKSHVKILVNTISVAVNDLFKQ